MPGGNAVKIAIIVVALGVALVLLARSRRDVKPKDEGQLAQRDLVCTKCQNHFQMPTADYQAAMKAAPKPTPMEGEGGARVRGRGVKPVMLKCPKCGADAAVLGAKCQNSDNWYPMVKPDGTPGSCPD
jgi:hypothetical protein